MDTTEIATVLGTTPRILRQFLRSPISSYVAVGSGSRYIFTEKDIPTLKRRFAEWTGAGKPKPDTPTAAAPRKSKSKKANADQASWAEEGPVVIEDIRDPRVRRRVKAASEAAEERLSQLLLAKGMHITQLGDRQAS